MFTVLKRKFMKKILPILVLLAITLIGCNTSAPDYSNGWSIPQSKCTQVFDGLAGSYRCLNVNVFAFDDFFAATSAKNQGNAANTMNFTNGVYFTNVTVRGDVESTNTRYRLGTVYTPIACQNNSGLICPQVITYTVIDTQR